MGFLSGSATFERFRIKQDPTGDFGEEHLKILREHRIQSAGSNLYEAPAVGFTGGSHLLDTDFDLSKNIIGETLHLGIRTDSCVVPGPIKQAWMQIELRDVLEDSPGKRPTKAQREEAQEAVDARCREEAEQGNYLRMNVTPVLWDAETGTILLGSTSETSNSACVQFLNQAFGLELEWLTSGSLALEIAEAAGLTANLFETGPAPLHPTFNGHVVWWNGMGDNHDYLGNEFLLWLWWHLEQVATTLDLSDGSDVSCMFARTLSLDCPLGENGKESFSAESPVVLPESMLAIRMGKLPRKAGLTLVRQGEQFDLTLKAETFSIGAAKSSDIGDTSPSRDALDRIQSLKNGLETLDLLFEHFCHIRLADPWTATGEKISAWLQSETPLRQQARHQAA